MSPETTAPLASAAWRKSTHSGDQGACVEFALLTQPAPDSTIASTRDGWRWAYTVMRYVP